jgi:hypothetical protein
MAFVIGDLKAFIFSDVKKVPRVQIDMPKISTEEMEMMCEEGSQELESM